MTPNDPKKGASGDPFDLHVEVNAAMIEALLATRGKTLKPLAEMLGGFYANLLKQDMPSDLAGLCVLKLLEGTLASWIMSDRGHERGEDE